MKIGEMTAPRWGVPDWRDEDAYPGPETPMHEWRWQFLRRRPDYRAFWLARAKAEFEESRQFAEMIQKKNPDYPAPKWRQGWVVKESFFGGMSDTLDPSFPNYQPNTFEPKGGGHSVWRAKYEEEQAASDAGLMSIEFDLNRPIPEQINRAEKMLKTEQISRHGALPKGERHHTGKWEIYLRVLDARDDGQSWSVINREILRYTRNEPQAAKQVWEQAQGLMFKTGS